MRLRDRGLLLLLALPFAAAGPACGQAYPVKPIRMIVPFPSGAGADVVARFVALALVQRMGQNVVVDNRSGAAGTIGAEAAARAAPDGYTLLVASASQAVNASLYRNLTYDLLRDFNPVALMASAPHVLAVSAALPVASVKELVAYAKAKPRALNFASSGTGSSTHIAGELFKVLARVEMTHVPYKGATPALVALLGDEVQVAFFSIPSTLPHVKTGKLRLLGVGSLRRSELLPELPTIADSGVPGYESATWYGVMAPGGTRRPIIERLNREIVAAIGSVEMRERFAGQGAEPRPGTPEAFSAYLGTEVAKYARLVKAAGIQPQ